jgi:hypothetical protein
MRDGGTKPHMQRCGTQHVKWFLHTHREHEVQMVRPQVEQYRHNRRRDVFGDAA